MRIPASIVRQKLRFDLGQGFLAVINLAFVAIAASDKIATLTGTSAKTTIAILIPSAIVGVWLVGFALDKMQFYQVYQNEQNERNEVITALHNSIK